MPYAAQSDLAARLAPELLVLLADDDADGAADAAVLAAVLADASAEIDQALAARYVTPVDPITEILVRWCVDLAITRLYERRREAMSAEQADRVELARRALTAIADGLAGLAGAQPRLDAFAADSTRLDDDPVFLRGELDEY